MTRAKHAASDPQQVPAAWQPRADFGFVLLGGLMLTTVAGFVNTVVLAEASLAATHVTGSLSRLSADLGTGRADDAFRVLAVLGAFAIGAMVSGLLIVGTTLRIGRRYGMVTVLEGIALVAAALVIDNRPFAGVSIAAFAAGMQNAMASSYGGLIVRTTHVTGILTDIGFLLGQRLRGTRAPGWKLALLAALLVAFFAGGVAGAIGYTIAESASLFAPALVLIIAGGGYTLWRTVLRHKPERPVSG